MQPPQSGELHDAEGLPAAEGNVEAIRVGQQLQYIRQGGTGAHQRLKDKVLKSHFPNNIHHALVTYNNSSA